jgi:hypothetical protein
VPAAAAAGLDDCAPRDCLSVERKFCTACCSEAEPLALAAALPPAVALAALVAAVPATLEVAPDCSSAMTSWLKLPPGPKTEEVDGEPEVLDAPWVLPLLGTALVSDTSAGLPLIVVDIALAPYRNRPCAATGNVPPASACRGGEACMTQTARKNA